MPLMVCAVDRVIETTLGYSFDFKKGVPLHIPPRAVKAVMERGAAPVEGEEGAAAEATATPLTDVQREPTDPDERIAAIGAAIKALNAIGELQFTAVGKPNHNQLSRQVRFRVDALERDAAWELVQAEVTGT